MRFIFFIFALALCFILGVQYGVDRQEYAVESPVSQENVIEEINEIPEEQSIETSHLNTGDTTTAYKAASALESLVDLVYEVIVHFLYQISKLFY